MSQLRFRQVKQFAQDPQLVTGKVKTQAQVSLLPNVCGLSHYSTVPPIYLTQHYVVSLS